MLMASPICTCCNFYLYVTIYLQRSIVRSNDNWDCPGSPSLLSLDLSIELSLNSTKEDVFGHDETRWSSVQFQSESYSCI